MEALVFLGGPFLSSLYERIFGKIESFLQLRFNKQSETELALPRLEEWRSLLPKIQAVLNQAEAQETAHASVQTLHSDLKQLAYDMEDVLDEFKLEVEMATQQDQAEDSTSRPSKRPRLSGLSGSESLPLDICTRLPKINDITSKLQRIEREIKFVELIQENLSPQQSSTMGTGRPASTSLPEPHVYGREDDRLAILDLLLREKHHEHGVGVTPIVDNYTDVVPETQDITIPNTHDQSHPHRLGESPSTHGYQPTRASHPQVTSSHTSDEDIHIDDVLSSISQRSARPQLRIYTYGNIFLPHAATRLVTSCFTTHFKPYPDWSYVSSSNIQEWWRVFERSCEWDLAHHNEVYRIWHIFGAQHYRSIMAEIRRIKDPVKRRAKAHFMSDDAYAKMEAYWASLEFLQKSMKFKAIRATASEEGSQFGSCSATYSGQSISMSAHHEHMAQISAKTKEQTQEEGEVKSSQEIDEAAIISTASSGKRRGHVFGLGSEQYVAPGPQRSGFTGISPSEITQTLQLNEQVQKMMAEEIARRDAKYEKKLKRLKRRHQAEMLANRAAMEANRVQLELICQSLNLPCPSPQTIPHYTDESDSDNDEIRFA